MATQSVVHPVEQSKPAVVSFPAPETITQLELLTLLSLRGRVHQIERQLAAAEQSITARLKKGCSVEEGDHSAELRKSFPRNIHWKNVATRLAEKLNYGKGQIYVERIIRQTKPTRTISLVIK